MSNRPLIRSNVFPYHVTARCNNREAFPLSLSEVWEIFSLENLTLQVKMGAKVHAFVLMPNHFHMILSIPEFDLGKVMNSYMRNITVDINRKSRRTGRIFGGPYYWSLIDSNQYYGHALKYVYRNPVRAGLCAKVEDYPFSTYSGLVGRRALPFPLYFTGVGMEIGSLSDEPSEWLEWLNRPFSTESEERIRTGFSKRVFGPPEDRVTRKALPISELS